VHGVWEGVNWETGRFRAERRRKGYIKMDKADKVEKDEGEEDEERWEAAYERLPSDSEDGEAEPGRDNVQKD
jgi:glycine/D-amino acid oxidase-like deaminating enzyme